MFEYPELSTQERLLIERHLAATRLKEARRLERRKIPYNIFRDGVAYRIVLEGVDHFFSYLSTLPSDLVLDVGAGLTIGTKGLADRYQPQGLRFKATGLVTHPGIERHIGRDRFIATSAEVLRGQQDHSVAGVIALYSIAYSAAPFLVVDRLDRALVPGGAIKSVFRSPRYVPILKSIGTAQPFVELFSWLDYDVAVKENRVGSVMLAIKPGSSSDQTAQSLLAADAAAREDFDSMLPTAMYLRHSRELNQYLFKQNIRKQRRIPKPAASILA